MKPTKVSLALILAVSLATPAAAQRKDRAETRGHIDSTFAFNKGGDVELTLVTGEVRVTAWAKSEARVVAASDQGPISANLSSNRIKLTMSNHLPRGITTYDVMVPVGTRVSVTTVTGKITVSGTRSDVTLKSVSGNIDASDITGTDIEAMASHVNLQRADGTTRINLFGGSVTIAEISGDLDVDLVGGATHIEHGDLRSLKYHTVGGSFDFAGKLSAQGHYNIESLSGNITLRLPADLGATLEFETFTGRIRPVDFPVTLQPDDNNGRDHKDRQEVAINGGGARISIQTFGGDVFLRKLDAPNKKEE